MTEQHVTVSVRQPQFPLPTWLAEAKKHNGLHEIVGPKHNPQIIAWLKDVGITGALLTDETAWCAAAVNGTLKAVGIAGTGSAMARSYLTWGTSLLVPRIGCVAVYSRPPDPASGHATYWICDFGPDDLCYGGNQHNSMCFGLYPRDRNLGYRWPRGVAV